jgi:hypothetical protein
MMLKVKKKRVRSELDVYGVMFFYGLASVGVLGLLATGLFVVVKQWWAA